MESLYLLILLFFIIVLIAPISIRAKAFYSVKSNKGAFSLGLWKEKIKVAKLKVNGKKVYLQTKKKRQEQEIEIGDKELRFIQFFMNEVKNKIKVKYIRAYSKVGLSEPNYSAFFSASVSSIVLSFFARIKSFRNSAILSLRNYTSFTENNLILAINSNFSLSILDIIYSFIVSILKNKYDQKINLLN